MTERFTREYVLQEAARQTDGAWVEGYREHDDLAEILRAYVALLDRVALVDKWAQSRTGNFNPVAGNAEARCKRRVLAILQNAHNSQCD